MKKTLLKVLSSTIALTLVATAAIGTAPKKEIPVQEVNARPAQEETVKAPTVLDLVEEKIQEEKAVEVKVVKAAPVAVKAVEKAAPAEKIAEPEKAAEEVAVPEAKAPEAAPEIKTEAPKAEEIAAPEENAEPVMVWDVSASELDNVAMAFYAEPKAVEQVDIQEGTVYIRGTGAMEEAVYSHFMSTEKYLATTKALFEKSYGVEVDLVYDETITDVVELDMNIKYFSHETGKELFVTDEMREDLTPEVFLEYSPKTIIIEEGITNISDYAFVFCADLETVILPSTIENIGVCAFEHCDSLTTIVIPEDAIIEEGAFAYCDSLANVQLVNDAYYANDGMAVHADGENTGIRNLTADEINAYVNYWN